MPTFRDLQPGDRIQFRGIVGGCVQLQRLHVASVLHAFADHVVVDRGEAGTVVDAGNFLWVQRTPTAR